MKLLFISILVAIGLSSCQKKKTVFHYPSIENRSSIETHFNISYKNEFSNLEDLNDKEVVEWFQKQDSVTEDYFDNEDYIKTFQHYENLENRDSDLARSIRRSESDETFYLWKDTVLNRKVLYKRNDLTKEIIQIYDPIDFKDGEFEIGYYKPSYDGKYVALAFSKPGVFLNEVLILDCNTKNPVGETLKNTKPLKAGGIRWSPDSKSILYITYPNNDNDRNSFTSLYKIGSSGPKPIFKDGLNGISLFEENYPIPVFRSVNSNFLFIYVANASDFWDSYYLSTEAFSKGIYNWKKFYSAEDSIYHDWGKERNHKYYFKRLSRDNIELCVADMTNLDFKNPNILVKGNDETQLSGFQITKDEIYYTMTANGIKSDLYRYNTGNSKKLEVPISAGYISFDHRSPYHNDIWVEISGWTTNPKEYHLKGDKNFEFVELGMWPNYPEFNNIISELIEVESHDGTKIPLSIVRRKDHKVDGSAMGIITAYGAYGISESPFFHSPIADFVNEGNVYVSAHVRGGGEKGPNWHKHGMKSSKENSWKDLIACSDYLIRKKLIHPKRLGLLVNSAGAITGGMAVNERPDLFGTFTGFVPTLNVIRNEYIESIDDTDTAFEFGTIKEEGSYKDLLKMDPVVNLSPKEDHPSTLMIIGFKDYLIHPSGPGKYIALLQSNKDSNKVPYLLDVKFDAEHEIDWLEDYSKILYFTKTELQKRD